MIERFTDPEVARAWCAARRAAGHSLGFVPTMGALHAGHLALVERAAAENVRACVSIFVNPLQFDDPRDLERYPRDFEGDVELLDRAGAHMAFTGTLAQFFPGELDAGGRLAPERRVDPGPAAQGLEGEFRPGHFAGVATIVARLFELVVPDRVYFGLKDYQQCLVVRELARRRGGPEIVACPTVREASGLALSSRNALLDPAGRERALSLSGALYAAREAWEAGERDGARLESVLRAGLERGGVQPEYAAVRDPERWAAGGSAARLERAVALVAARIGAVRLIDSLPLGGEDGRP